MNPLETTLPKRLGSRKTVAAMTGFCTETIKRAGKRGELTEYKFNQRVVRYDLAEVAAWIARSSSKLQPA